MQILEMVSAVIHRYNRAGEPEIRDQCRVLSWQSDGSMMWEMLVSVESAD